MMLIVLYFFSWMFRIMQLTYRDAAGLWTEDWLKPYVGMAVNLVGSIWMVKATGSIAGVLVPTILVFFFIYTPWEAWVVVKYQFYRSWNECMCCWPLPPAPPATVRAGGCRRTIPSCHCC